jgi:uncharacterized membrane protein YjdF
MNFLFDRHFWLGTALGAVSYLVYFLTIKPLLFVGSLLLITIPYIAKLAFFLFAFYLVFLTIDGCLT